MNYQIIKNGRPTNKVISNVENVIHAFIYLPIDNQQYNTASVTTKLLEYKKEINSEKIGEVVIVEGYSD